MSTTTGSGGVTFFTPTSANTVPNIVGTGASSDSAGNSKSLGQNQFLNILVTQLKNQDPTQPVDDAQWISELAQFSSLEQMSNINTTLTGQNTSSQLSQASSLIGAQVTTSATDSNGTAIGGVVTGATVSKGAVSVTVGTNQVPLSEITGVTAPTSGSSS